MRGPSREQLAAWTAETKRIGFRHRNWSVFRRLAALAVTLLLAGLAVSLMDYPPALAAACWVAATIAGAGMLVWFLDTRRFKKSRPPGTS